MNLLAGRQTLFPWVPRMPLPTAIVRKDPELSSAHVVEIFTHLGWVGSAPVIRQVFSDMQAAFAGARPGYMASDMRYHDFGHTLQATVCVADLIDGLHRAERQPAIGQRTAELTVMAALLHDSGFLKLAGDTAGTGAKYAMVHEHRSCEFSRIYLPKLGVGPPEIEDVCTAISCTGPRNRISDHTFRHAGARQMACVLVTADYLAQMCAPDYPDKLDHLYAEFVEAFDWEGLPETQRPYRTALELKTRTPDFWHKFVLPMLDSEADGVHRYLAVTGQPNSYLQAVEDNLTEIQRRLQSGLVQT